VIELSPANIAMLESLLPAALVLSLRQQDPTSESIAEAATQLEAILGRLTPFVPAPVLDARLNPHGTGHIGGQYFHGTIVLANLAGFSALSAALAPLGRHGSEEISAILNRLFAVLLGDVYEYGGVLIKFGGETLTAFFDAGRLGANHTVLACAAALAMQRRMLNFASLTTSNGSFSLRLRIAAHVGRVFANEVGDLGHAELIVTGYAINRAVVALRSAAPGEVIISDEMRLVLPRAQTQPKVAGLFLLQSLPFEPQHPAAPPPYPKLGPPGIKTLHELIWRLSALWPYVPHDLPSRFMYGAAEEGEFRPVTVMFASFYPFSRLLALMDLPAALEQDGSIIGQVLNTYYTRTQSVIQRYGGNINTIDMETFGDRLMALFGAPITHEDDPARAVQAALTLQSALDSISQDISSQLHEWTELHPAQRALIRVASATLRQKIALASGTVFAGIIGSPQRHAYTVMGATVSLASRLLATANDGDVLLTSWTRRAVHQFLEAEPMPPLTLKDYEQSIPIFRALRWSDVNTRTSGPIRADVPLVGRQRELAQLREVSKRALQSGVGAGQVVALIGEAGIGKSRLVADALRTIQVTIPSAVLIQELCQSYEQTTPYATIARLLRRILRLSSATERAQPSVVVQEQLEQLVPSWSRFAPVLGPLLNLPLPDTDLTILLTAEQRRERLHDLVIELCLATARRQPLVIVVDDLQWVDASSHAIIGRLAAELVDQPLLLVLIYRPEPALAEPWRELGNCSITTLAELTREDSEALLRALLDGYLPAPLQPLIERTRGMPFFLEETIRYLVGTGVLRRRPSGEWDCTRSIDSSAIPIQIEQLILARLDRLDEDTRSFVQVAAVIGQQFSKRLLAAMQPRRGQREKRMADLVDAMLLVPDEDALEVAYRFRHAMIRDVAYGSILFARRRKLHAQVAAAIQKIYSDAELEEQRVVLAEHYLRAEQIDRAFPHFLKAAQHAQARFANSEALALYRQALATAPWRTHADAPSDLATAALIYENMGDVLALTGDYVGARETYGWLQSLLEQGAVPNQSAHNAALERKIGSTYENQGTLEMAVDWLDRAVQRIAQAPAGPDTTLEYARILSDMGWVFFRQRDQDRAQDYLEQAAALIEPLNLHDEQSRILNRLGGIAYTRGDIVLAQRYVQQSLGASERSGNLMDQANALTNLGLLTESQGLLADSIDYSLQAMQINEQIGSRRMLAITALNIGWAYYNLDQYEQAHQYFTQGLERAIEVRDTYQQMRLLRSLGYVLTALGQWQGAERAIQQSQFIALQLHLPIEQLDGHVALAELALQQGDRDTAIQEYQQGKLLVIDSASEEYGRFQRLEAKIALAQGDTARAIELLRANQVLFTQLENVPEADRSQKMLNQLLATSNQLI
jgi:class 3 adenylate cyclase/tetratricopeptide (TPR) repeat protein